MCLFPFGNILIPPTDKARKIADYLRVAIGLHIFLGAFLMLGGRYVDGVFDLLGALIGFMAIKNAEGYSFQCVLSYCVFCGMDVFWSCLRLILYFSNASSTDTGSMTSWQYYIFIIGVIIAPFIYMFAAVTAYYLYKELRNVVNEAAAGGAGAEEMGGGGYAAQREAPPASAGSGQGWAHAESHPSAPSGFKAFSGTGNRLGGS